jgi:Lipopolysaccharide-assembly
MTRRHAALAALLFGLALPGCESGGHFTVLGYTTKPNYDTCIRTVYVPMFQSGIMQDETRRTIPQDLTRAIVREIESKTPYKVVSDRTKADTELSGTVLLLTKNTILRNQLNENREQEVVLTAAIVWRNLRTGEILSKARRAPTVVPTPGIPALEIPEATGLPPPPPVPPPNTAAGPGAEPVLVTGLGDFIPELGQSNATAYQQAINRLATQIVALMEKPW